MRETQGTIEEWRAATFEGHCDVFDMMVRANEEMAELIRAVTYDPGNEPKEIADEAADVVIMLYSLATIAGFDLHEAVDRKMAVNRKRRWIPAGAGRYQHIEPEGFDD